MLRFSYRSRALLATVIFACLLTSTSGMAAKDLTAELQVCKAIDSGVVRLTCFDKLVESNVALVSPREAPDAAALFGRATDDTREVIDLAAGYKSASFLTARLFSIKKNAYRKYRLVLDNDQVWQQSDDGKIALRVGDEISIKRGAMGSYRLKKSGGGITIRVKRVE